MARVDPDGPRLGVVVLYVRVQEVLDVQVRSTATQQTTVHTSGLVVTQFQMKWSQTTGTAHWSQVDQKNKKNKYA